MSNVFVLPSMYLTSTLARPKGQEENCLEGQMLQRGLLNWFKWRLCQLVQNQGEVPGGNSPPAFGSVSLETIQETSFCGNYLGDKFSSLLILMGEFPSLSAMADV